MSRIAIANALYDSDEKYGPFTQEAQEISNATWLSGGRVMVNKKTWYAHYHKGHRGKGYGFSNEQYKKHGIASEKGVRGLKRHK